jgi:hypothetical protein
MGVGFLPTQFFEEYLTAKTPRTQREEDEEYRVSSCGDYLF